eukprot:12688181-Ditylum_brightwellii.AAC.1
MMNLFCTCKIIPKLLAEEFLNGTFNYDAASLVPSGTKVIIHTKIATQESFELKGKEGWYLGPSREHCMCYTCYIPKTKSEVQAYAAEFFTHQYDLSHITLAKEMVAAAMDIVRAITNPSSKLWWDKLGNEILQTVKALGDRFINIPSKRKGQNSTQYQ